MSRPAAVIVHSLDHASAAIAASAERQIPVILCTAPGAAAFAGVEYLAAMVGKASGEHPGQDVDAAIDCGADAGTAQAALRAGWKIVLYRGRPDLARKLQSIAETYQARVIRDTPTALDLEGCADATGACRKWFGAA